jgi:hypothetical protein
MPSVGAYFAALGEVVKEKDAVAEPRLGLPETRLNNRTHRTPTRESR